YIADSDPEEDPKEDPTDYPNDGGHDDDDDDESSDDNEDDDDDVKEDEDEEELEEHPAPADFVPPLVHCVTARMYEVGESSSASATRPTGGFRSDYSFIATLDREIRRDPERDIGYGITDT
ncbi:hypothetical protein Tco_1205705, partial [Tanacetum coccineum]